MSLTLTGIIVLVAALLVVVGTSLLKAVDMSTRVKNVIAVVLSSIAGALTVFIDNGWDFSQLAGESILQTALVVYGASQIFYNFILKGTGVEAKLADSGFHGTGGRHRED